MNEDPTVPDVAERTPGGCAALLQKARLAASGGERAAAAAMLENAYNEFLGVPELLFGASTSLSEWGATEAAARFAAEFIRWEEAEASQLLDAARFLLAAGDVEKAALAWEKATSLDPDSPYLLVERAKLEFTGGFHRVAIEHAVAASERVPENAPIAVEAGWMLVSQHRYAEAATLVRKAMMLSPADPSLLLILARSEAALGRMQAAEVAHEALAEAAAGNRAIINEVVRFHLHCDNYERALRLLDDHRSTEDDEPSREALRLEIRALQGRGRSAIRLKRLRDIKRREQALEGALDADDARRARGLLMPLDLYDAAGADTVDAIFDQAFYRSQFPGGQDGDLLEHYIISGLAEMLSPSPLFDPYYYRDHASSNTAPGSLLNYLAGDWRRNTPFHEDFDLDYFFETTGLEPGSVNPLVHAIREKVIADRTFVPRSDETRSETFNRWMTQLGRKTSNAAKSRALKKFLLIEPQWSKFEEVIGTLFDFTYYSTQLVQRGLSVPPENRLAHFMEGWRLGLEPHPLFRTSFYLQQHSEVKESGRNPFLHYVEIGAAKGYDPHPLFKTGKYWAATRPRMAAGANALLHYLKTPISERVSLSEAFAPDFYRRQHAGVDWSACDPLIHYLAFGAGRGSWPHPVFDPDYYERQVGIGAQEVALTNRTPSATAESEKDRDRVSPLEHFELSPEPRAKTFALFDPDNYARRIDLSNADCCPMTHFLRVGFWEDREPSRLKSEQYVMGLAPDISFNDRPALWEYYARDRNKRTRLVFVGQDASGGDASRALLRIVAGFAAYSNVECLTILHQGGPLVSEFERCSHTYLVASESLQLRGGIVDSLEGFWRLLDDNLPVAALCNTIEQTDYATYLKGQGLPVIFLADSVDDVARVPDVGRRLQQMDLVVFPTQAAAERLLENAAVDDERCRVLTPSFSSILTPGHTPSRRGGAAIDGALPLSQRDVVILGCEGSAGRRDFDLFCDVAALARRHAPSVPLKFLWKSSREQMAECRSAAAELEGLVSISAGLADLGSYLAISDVFLATSRMGSGGTVSEALWSGLPVVCFEGSSAAELFGGAAVTVRYPDLTAMAAAVVALADDEHRRQELGEAGRRYVALRSSSSPIEELGHAVIALARLKEGALGQLEEADLGGRRVYFAASALTPRATSAFMEGLVEELGAAGWGAEFLLTAGRFSGLQRKAAFDAPAASGAPVRFLQPRSADRKSQREILRAFLARNSPCIVVDVADAGAVVRDLPPGVRSVGVVNGSDAAETDRAYHFGRYWDRIVASSEAIANELISINPAFETKIDTIPFGCAAPEPSRLREILAAKAAGANPIELMYVATPDAQSADCCELALRLSATGAEFRLSLVGDDRAFPGVRRRLAAQIRSGEVALLGPLNRQKIIERMVTAHVVLNFSDSPEAILSLLDGAAFGCIPVTYPLAEGEQTYIAHGRNGFVVSWGELDAVVAHVRELQTDGALRARMALAAAELVGDFDLSMAGVGARYGALFESIMQEVPAHS